MRPAVGSLDAELFPFIPKVGLCEIGNRVSVLWHVSMIFMERQFQKEGNVATLVKCSSRSWKRSSAKFDSCARNLSVNQTATAREKKRAASNIVEAALYKTV